MTSERSDDRVLDALLWSVIDGQAVPWARRRGAHIIGSRAAYDRELSSRRALDLALRQWGAGLPAQSDAIMAPARDCARASVRRHLEASPFQLIVGPAAVLGLVVAAVAWQFGLHGFYAIVAYLVERLP